MAGNKSVLWSDLEKVGQGQNLQKSLYLSYHMTELNKTFVKIVAMLPATKMSSAYLENVGQRHCLQISLYLGYYMTNF